MKTTTILNAYDAARSFETKRRIRQYEKFMRELERRIEAGDRARAIVREVAQAYQEDASYLDLGRSVTAIIHKHSDWLDELPT